MVFQNHYVYYIYDSSALHKLHLTALILGRAWKYYCTWGDTILPNSNSKRWYDKFTNVEEVGGRGLTGGGGGTEEEGVGII